MKSNCLLLLLLMSGSLLTVTSPAMAHSGIIVDVEMINAFKNVSEVDPELYGFAEEVGPVLNFKGFKLLKKSRVRLKTDETRGLLLSNDRRLLLKLDGFEADQARLHPKILKNQDEIFATTLMIVNNGSAIIGGPELENGVMLLRIHGKLY